MYKQYYQMISSSTKFSTKINILIKVLITSVASYSVTYVCKVFRIVVHSFISCSITTVFSFHLVHHKAKALSGSQTRIRGSFVLDQGFLEVVLRSLQEIERKEKNIYLYLISSLK